MLLHPLEGNTVKITRTSQVAMLALLGSLSLAACGSDNNTTTTTPAGTSSASSSGSTSAGDCLSGTLNAEGSSAQKNAIDEAIATYGEKCSGATINYKFGG